MKSAIKSVLLCLIITLSLASLAGCVQKESIEMVYGQTQTLVLEKEQDGVTWQSDNSDVVAASGADITATGPGTATVLAKVGEKVVAEFSVTVTVVEISDIYLQSEEMMLEIGGSGNLSYKLFPENASDYGVTFTSMDSKIATVDADGSITAVAPGSTNVVVSTPSGKTASCAVTVEDISAIEKLNEKERILFDYMVKSMLPNFYNAPAIRLRNLWVQSTPSTVTLDCAVEIQGTNKMGGTLFKYYGIIYNNGSGFYLEFAQGASPTDPSLGWVEADYSKIDYRKINEALAEYWESSGF